MLSARSIRCSVVTSGARHWCVAFGNCLDWRSVSPYSLNSICDIVVSLQPCFEVIGPQTGPTSAPETTMCNVGQDRPSLQRIAGLIDNEARRIGNVANRLC